MTIENWLPLKTVFFYNSYLDLLFIIYYIVFAWLYVGLKVFPTVLKPNSHMSLLYSSNKKGVKKVTWDVFHILQLISYYSTSFKYRNLCCLLYWLANMRTFIAITMACLVTVTVNGQYGPGGFFSFNRGPVYQPTGAFRPPFRCQFY